MSENPVEDASTDVVLHSDPRAMIESLRSGNVGVYSTIAAATFADRVAILAALTDTVPLDEHLGEPIALTNFIAQAIEIRDERTGTSTPAARIILVDADGTSYACVSSGVMRALENLVGIAGQPSEWEAPIVVTAVQEKTRANFRVYTLKVVAPASIPA